LQQFICDEAESAAIEKGESKGKRGWRMVKNKELNKINN
jgi:hypothetical protein